MTTLDSFLARRFAGIDMSFTDSQPPQFDGFKLKRECNQIFASQDLTEDLIDKACALLQDPNPNKELREVELFLWKVLILAQREEEMVASWERRYRGDYSKKVFS